MRTSNLPIIIVVGLTLFLSLVYLLKSGCFEKEEQITLTPTLVPTPTPTPRPLTFAEMNALYGPCVYLPTLMYHHVQDMKVAKEKNQADLTVDASTFRAQMQYLKDKGYNTVSFSDLARFFDSGVTIPKKSVLITFDDGYDDFYLNALPILQNYAFKASVFIPTGLINNPNYMLWQQVMDASYAGVSFNNHTWSHKNVKQNNEVVEKEIALADSQLAEKGLNNPKVFAYPYGLASGFSEGLLLKLGYSFAFTTKTGSTLCVKQRFELPRVRIGNSQLSSFGL